MMELTTMTVDDTVEEIMRIHRLLPARPGIDDVIASRSLIQNVEREDQLRLEEIAKQSKGKDVPEELFKILQEMERNTVHFQSRKQRREAEKLLDLEVAHLVFDELIQRASECIKSYSSSRPSRSLKSSNSSFETLGLSSSSGSSSFFSSSLSSTVTTTVKSPVSSSSASSSFGLYNEKASEALTSKDDMYMSKTRASFNVDGVGFGVRSKDAMIVDHSFKPAAVHDEDGKLSLIKLASLIEISAKKGTRELLLQGKLSDQIDWLPDSMGKLSNLTKLDLSENKIAILPETIGGLPSSQTLDLHANKIQELPESVGELLKLIDLNLQGNQFTVLPAPVARLVRLQKLDLSSNGLTVLSETIGMLTHLQILNIETNDIEEIPHAIGRCTSLKELHADYNRLKALPEAVGRIESLEILTVRYNNIKQLPTTMASLSSLRHLNVSFNELEAIPESLCFATSLVKLDISNNFADLQSLPRSIGNLEMLDELSGHNNQIRILPDSFGMLTRLRILNLEGNPLIEPLRNVVEKGAQAIVQYMANLAAQRDSKAKRKPKKQRKSWARLFFLFRSNKHKRNRNN